MTMLIANKDVTERDIIENTMKKFLMISFTHKEEEILKVSDEKLVEFSTYDLDKTRELGAVE